jgi:hypothetical protein
LKIPPGHPLVGQPLVLPDYGVSFLRDALAVPESLLSIGRKNAKSAVIAVAILGRLVGPLRVDGWRGGDHRKVCIQNYGKEGQGILNSFGFLRTDSCPTGIQEKAF